MVLDQGAENLSRIDELKKDLIDDFHDQLGSIHYGYQIGIGDDPTEDIFDPIEDLEEVMKIIKNVLENAITEKLSLEELIERINEIPISLIKYENKHIVIQNNSKIIGELNLNYNFIDDLYNEITDLS